MSLRSTFSLSTFSLLLYQTVLWFVKMCFFWVHRLRAKSASIKISMHSIQYLCTSLWFEYVMSFCYELVHSSGSRSANCGAYCRELIHRDGRDALQFLTAKTKITSYHWAVLSFIVLAAFHPRTMLVRQRKFSFQLSIVLDMSIIYRWHC